MEFGFEKLAVWHNSRALVADVYKMVYTFPREEKYGLSDQLRRAAISVPSNIAEGCGRYSVKEKIHFVEIAYGSLMEVVCQITLALDLNLVSIETKDLLLSKAEIVAKQLSAYRRSLLQRLDSKLKDPELP